MQRITLNAEPRDLGKKEEELTLTQLRGQGYIPCVIYGHGKPEQFAVEIRHFKKATHTDAGINALFNVKKGSDVTLTVIKEVQRDVFTQDPIHIDFQRINLNEKLTVHVPIHTKGEAVGVKQNGGLLEHIQREIDVRCKPDDIPAHIDVDVSKLDIHDAIKVSDLKLAEGVEILTPGDHTIVHVVQPRVEEEPAPAAEGEAKAEPEVIARGKEKEGAEGAEGDAKAAPAKKEEKK